MLQNDRKNTITFTLVFWLKMKYIPVKHHRQSIRLKGYDYSNDGAYFVTICVANRECLFGCICEGKMQLNKIGEIVHSWWNLMNQKYMNIELDDFIIMPNHLHGIIMINNQIGSRGEVTSPLQPVSLGKIIAYFKYQSTKHINSIRKTPGQKIWQRNYYERIIRNENEYYHIQKYISENSLKWNIDKENPNIMVSNQNDR